MFADSSFSDERGPEVIAKAPLWDSWDDMYVRGRRLGTRGDVGM
jgi:hypothetical protein